MKFLIALAALGLSVSAFAGPQQEKMKDCNMQAKGMKCDQRKAFMKTCLSAKPADSKIRMKECNAEAKGKKGEYRKSFLSSCLKSDVKADAPAKM